MSNSRKTTAAPPATRCQGDTVNSWDSSSPSSGQQIWVLQISMCFLRFAKKHYLFHTPHTLPAVGDPKTEIAWDCRLFNYEHSETFCEYCHLYKIKIVCSVCRSIQNEIHFLFIVKYNNSFNEENMFSVTKIPSFLLWLFSLFKNSNIFLLILQLRAAKNLRRNYK